MMKDKWCQMKIFDGEVTKNIFTVHDQNILRDKAMVTMTK